MRYALIGCGRVAVNHMNAAKINGFDIAAVCDVDPSQIDVMFRRLGWGEAAVSAIRRYTCYEEMLARETPDFVSVATPSGSHAEIALAVMEAGVNVLIEKPVALSLPDADRLIETARKTGVTAGVCHQNRFNLSVQEMRRHLENGDFGRLSNAAVTVRWSRGPEYYAQAPWRGTWADDGGCLMNQCIHGIDLLLWMCGGDLKTVFGRTRRAFHPYIEAEDLGAAVLEFDNGVLATVEGTVNVAGKDLEEHLTLIGEKGSMKLGGTSANNVAYIAFDGEKERNTLIEKTENVYGNGHISLFCDFAGAVEAKRAPYVTLEDGRNALSAVLSIYYSAYTGLPVSAPPPDLGTAYFAEKERDDA